jgi:hypothetical protein
MAHFAELDHENKVKRVLVVANHVIADSDGNDDEQKGIDYLQSIYGASWWKQTSYNGTFRKNYAGRGMLYDGARDAFISSQPYPSWVFDEDTCVWEAPVAIPPVPSFVFNLKLFAIISPLSSECYC